MKEGKKNGREKEEMFMMEGEADFWKPLSSKTPCFLNQNTGTSDRTFSGNPEYAATVFIDHTS